MMKRANKMWFCLAWVSAFVFVLGVESEAYIWHIGGTDNRLGPYEGTLEILDTEKATMQVIRVVSFADYVHADGRRLDLVWTGTLEMTGSRSATIAMSLQRADFIKRVESFERTEADAVPLAVSGAVSWETDPYNLSIVYRAPDIPSFDVSETATLVSESGQEPTWRSGRSLNETHREPAEITKRLLFRSFDSYHDLPDIKPYRHHSLFKKAVHYQIVDHSDFEYYRTHPDRLRLVNKVVDPISLAEAEVVADACRASWAEKAQFYQDGLTKEFVGAHGMVVRSIDAMGEEETDLDSGLWTGIYAYTQALRYKMTGEEEARNNVRRSLRGTFTLMDITGDPRIFARTLRLARSPVSGDWQRGSGDFSHLDWLAGGNNDMGKGLVLAMLAGWEVLPEGDPMRLEIPAYAQALSQLCVFREEASSGCSAGAIDSNVSSVNPGMAELLAGITTGDRNLVFSGLEWLRRTPLLQYPDIGAGVSYQLGVSDWSGNHLSLVSTLILQHLLAYTDDAELHRKWIEASRQAWLTLRPLDHPLHAALAVAAGALTDPAESAQAVDQVIRGLTSFPYPKHPYPVDHRIRADFIMSPFPLLPWKRDWTSNPNRRQSLIAYPRIEQPMDSYLWNDGHFLIASEGLGDRRVPGVDYLFLYWLAMRGDIRESP